MSRLHSLTAHRSSVPAPGLKVIDEGPAQPRRPAFRHYPAPRLDGLSPMPLAGLQLEMELELEMEMEMEEEELQSPDDFYSGSFLPCRHSGEDGRLRELPRLVPLQCDLFAATGDPWAVHSIADLLKLYLPEISISTGVVTACGLIAGRLVHHFGRGMLGSEVVVGYLAVQALCVALVYVFAKDAPYLRVRGWMRKHLLTALLLMGAHLLAYGLLVAGR